MIKTVKYIAILSVFVFVSISCVQASENQYGAKYDASIPLKPISFIIESKGINGKVLSFKGEMIDQCKSNGCWFELKDNTGEVLVDLKPNDIKTPLGIVGQKVKLNGQVNMKDGKIQVDAISIIIEE